MNAVFADTFYWIALADAKPGAPEPLAQTTLVFTALTPRSDSEVPLTWLTQV